MLTNSNRKNCLYFIFDLLNYINLGFSVLLKLVFICDSYFGCMDASVGMPPQKTSALKSEAAQPRAGFAEVRPAYLEALTLVERLHRRLLDVIKDEFDRRGRSDVNSVQALLLYNISDKELTAGELRTRGYYLGSNVSYNVKKLAESGYLHHARSRVDRRAVRISLTEKGRASTTSSPASMTSMSPRWSKSAGSTPASLQSLTSRWSGSNVSGQTR
jgi:DNA-binding MarR family transcriptional regulator